MVNQGKLVKTAPTKELLSSFTKACLQVTLRGGNNETTIALKQLPGIINVSLVKHSKDIWVYNVQASEEWIPQIQRLITHFAAENNLALITNQPLEMGLESVFLQLIGA
jgi:ABC-2 type transport system ATP-binding protein